MSRLHCIVLGLMFAVALPGCDGESTYRDRPISYWIDASRSPNLQTKQQAIGALMAVPQDAKAAARLAEIRSETLARRNENWTELTTWLQDSAKTRERRAIITAYIGNMPDSEDGILQYSATAFPGKWEETREILLKRLQQAESQDRELYQTLLHLH